jgi:hypothetical protein
VRGAPGPDAEDIVLVPRGFVRLVTTVNTVRCLTQYPFLSTSFDPFFVSHFGLPGVLTKCRPIQRNTPSILNLNYHSPLWRPTTLARSKTILTKHRGYSASVPLWRGVRSSYSNNQLYPLLSAPCDAPVLPSTRCSSLHFGWVGYVLPRHGAETLCALRVSFQCAWFSDIQSLSWEMNTVAKIFFKVVVE